jgi:hypothetical protein
MQPRYLLHHINHTILVVDISSVGIADEIYPSEGKAYALSSLRFQTWQSAEQFLLRVGANRTALAKTWSALKSSSVAVLTVA